MNKFVFCSHCGAKNPITSKFCYKCGKPLIKSSKPKTTSRPFTTPKATNNSNNSLSDSLMVGGLMFVGIFVVIGLIILSGLLYMRATFPTIVHVEFVFAVLDALYTCGAMYFDSRKNK